MGGSDHCYFFGCTTVVETVHVDVLAESNNDVKLQNSNCMFHMTINSSPHFVALDTRKKRMR